MNCWVRSGSWPQFSTDFEAEPSLTMLTHSCRADSNDGWSTLVRLAPLLQKNGSSCSGCWLLRRRDPDPHRSFGAVGPREVWNGEQLRRRRRSCSRQCAEVAVLELPPPVEVADDARQ